MTTLQEIESLFDAYKQAVFQKDLGAFAALFDGEVLVFDLWEKWSYDGLPAWHSMAEGWFSSLGAVRDAVTFDDVRIQMTGEMTLATAFVRFTAMSEKGEALRYLENRLTWVVRKNAGVWKIIHEHTSSPVDFASMKVKLTRDITPPS